MKKVLFVASECVPFIKTGGLADVVGSLPKYFNKEEYDVRVILPKYLCMSEEWKSKMNYVTHFYMDLAWRSQYVGVLEMQYDGVQYPDGIRSAEVPKAQPWRRMRTSRYPDRYSRKASVLQNSIHCQ